MKRSFIATTVAAVAVGIGLTSTAFAAGPWDRHDGRNGHPLVGSIIMGVVVAAVVGLVVYLVAKRPSAAPQTAAPSTTASAEGILAERLARGEISPDDYRTMLAALKGETTPAS